MRSRTRSRRWVSFTREGWYFLFILAFIVVGSILRQINLLIVLASMMIPAILFNWRIAVSAIRWLRVRHNVPDWVFSGQPTAIEIELRNTSRTIPAWNILLRDTIRQVLPAGAAAETSVQLVCLETRPGRTSHVSYRCFLSDRGVYQLGPTTVVSRYPFGLVNAALVHRATVELHAAPRLGELKPTWHQRRSSVAVGVASARRRRGWMQDEYYGLRPWHSGDSLRRVHWRSTARLGNLMVRQYDQPTDRDFALLLDLFAPAHASPGRRVLVEEAVSFVATILARLNYSVHGRVAIALCGDSTAVFVNQGAGEFLRSVMQQLAAIQPAPETDVARQLPELAAKVSAGTPLIVVSTRDQQQVEPPRSAASQTAPWLPEASIDWIRVGADHFYELFEPATAFDTQGMPVDNPTLIAPHAED